MEIKIGYDLFKTVLALTKITEASQNTGHDYSYFAINLLNYMHIQIILISQVRLINQPISS